MTSINLKPIHKRLGNNMNETGADLDCIICMIWYIVWRMNESVVLKENIWRFIPLCRGNLFILSFKSSIGTCVKYWEWLDLVPSLALHNCENYSKRINREQNRKSLADLRISLGKIFPLLDLYHIENAFCVYILSIIMHHIKLGITSPSGYWNTE